MTAMALDTGIAFGLSLLAALWIVRRGVRALRKRGGGCACPSAKDSCGAASQMAGDLKAAAARGAARAGQADTASKPLR